MNSNSLQLAVAAVLTDSACDASTGNWHHVHKSGQPSDTFVTDSPHHPDAIFSKPSAGDAAIKAADLIDSEILAEAARITKCLVELQTGLPAEHYGMGGGVPAGRPTPGEREAMSINI